MSLGKILAIDDEKNIRNLIKNEFSSEGFDVSTAGSGEEGLKIFEDQVFDLVLLDIKLPKLNGIETLKQMKHKSSSTQVIMITGYGDVETAVMSMKYGAYDYITKPFKLSELLDLAKQAVKDIRGNFGEGDTPRDNRSRLKSKKMAPFIHCPSPEMKKVYQRVRRVASTDITVLIHGETGVGKDVLASQIHFNSARKKGPFVVIDCGMLSQNLAESELYGHRKGSFSGASESKVGLVEKSNKGTLFLDEIGNIDLDLQKKFLRFLETQRYRRVGETRESQVDTRLILATNMDMQAAMKKGTLREDLFYRMDMIQIVIPPLRKRRQDIACLAEHFVKHGIIDTSSRKISSDAQKILLKYSWPGNIRELQSSMTKAAIFADGDTITPGDLPSHIVVNKNILPRHSKTLKDMEKEHIMAILNKTGGNQSEASKVLGINRKTLYKKIHRYKIFS